ncbi:histidine phosphatase family protein [Candidatus Saccharibacteria bacterium]|nr:histidine phosphatase family protein [Candidatus Saccharibacteria bacterium]
MRQEHQPHVIMIRHGHSTGNAGQKTADFTKIPLTEDGQREARYVADAIVNKLGIKGIAGIVVTPYLRTQQTAEPLVDLTNHSPIVMPGLREITYLQSSRADGKTFDQRAGMRNEFWQLSLQNPNYVDEGEQAVDSVNSFLQRIRTSMGTLAAMATQNTEGSIVVFSHEFPISTAVSFAMGKTDDEIIADMCRAQKPVPSIRNTQAVGFTIENGEFIFASESDFDLFPAV